MSNETDCPLCDREIVDWQDLAEHLAACHQDVKVNGNGLWLNRKGTVLCWCRAWFKLGQRGFPSLGMKVELGQFAQHLKRRGGPAAHLLELTLGVKRK